MYKIKLAFTILTIILVIAISCGCIDDSGSKVLTESPLEFEHKELHAVLNGEWQETPSTYVRTDYPVQKEDEMYLGYEPPHRQISATLNLINTGSTTLKDIRIGLEIPDHWETAYLHDDYINELEPNEKYALILSVYSEPIPKYLGLDIDEDNFADLFDPDNNELGIDCYNNNGELKYSQEFSTGLECKEYKFKVQAWGDGISKISIELTVGFEI